MITGGEFWNCFKISDAGNKYTYNNVLAEDYYYRDKQGKLILVDDNITAIRGYVTVCRGLDLSKDDIVTLSRTEYEYSGNENKPEVTVKAGRRTFVENQDYTVSYGDMVHAGTVSVTVAAIEVSGSALIGETTRTYTIGKASQAAPEDLVGMPEDVDERANGSILGVNEKMEYRRDEEDCYTPVTGTAITGLADGIYYVRYKETDNYYASPETEIVLRNDTKLTVTVPASQQGYTLTTDKTELKWNESLEVSFALKDGYSKTDRFAVKVNGEPVELTDEDACIIENAQSNLNVTVEGVADITAPEAEITITTHKWKEFFHEITFGLFFNKKQEVSITAEDAGSGVNRVYYYLSSSALDEEAVMKLDEDVWTEYETFSLNPEDKYIIYVKAVDNAGNITYISSAFGIEIDIIAPVINGVEDGTVYYDDTTFSVTDKNLYEIRVDGDPVSSTDGSCTITADGKEHTIVAIDKAGNFSKTITVTVLPVASVGDKMKDITADNISISDKQKIMEVLEAVNRIVNSGKEFPEADIARLEEIKANAQQLLAVVERAESAEALINSLPDTITREDAEKISAADKAYNALSEHEKSMLDEQVKNRLQNAKAELEKLNKEDTPSAKPSVAPSAAPGEKPAETVIPGDVDGNGTVELQDAQLVLRAALKIIMLDERAEQAADVDGNGVVELADAQQVLKYALKIITSFN